MIIAFKVHRNNYFCSKWDAIFEVVKMNFGSKFGPLGIFSYRYLAVMKISRKSGAETLHLI